MSWVLVTGASSGLGLEFCNQLAGRGHNVVMVARRENVLVTQAQRIENYYGNAAVTNRGLPDAPARTGSDFERVLGGFRYCYGNLRCP